MRRFFGSFGTLATKLIITVGILLFGGSLLFGLIYFKFQERVMLGNIESQARLSANLVKKGIHHGMLRAEPQVIQLAVDALGSAQYVRQIRVYDTAGKIAYASDAREIGTTAPKGSPVYAYLAGQTPEPEFVPGEGEEKVMAFLTPILNELACNTAPCHFHSPEDRVLGVLQTNFSTSAIGTTERQMFVGTLVLGGVFVFSISIFLVIIIYKFVTRPVGVLQEGMRRLAKGDLDKPIEIPTQDEMGLLARTFNSMAFDIKHYRERLENWTKELQEEVDKKTAEIMKAQESLIDAEKLASLGRMAAGVAHELNNPLTGVITFAHLLRERIPPEDKQDIEDIDVIIEQANKCSNIIKGLLGFARKGATEKLRINVNDLIESSISMVATHSKFHNIRTPMELSDSLPPVVVDPNQLQQVIVNVVTNAADAMNDRGEIRIATRAITVDGQSQVEMEFTDTGPGILPEHMSRIFEPFFTTKPVGKGTGLGLPVSYGIIKRHGGDIIVRSQVGKGTSFLIRLPAAQQKQGPKGEG